MLSEIIHPGILRTKWAGYKFRRQFRWTCMAVTHEFQDGKKMVSRSRQLTTCMSFPPSYKSNLVLWGSGVAAIMRWLVLTVVPSQCSSRSLASAGLVGLSHEAQYLGLQSCELSQLGFKKVISRKIYEELGSMCIDISPIDAFRLCTRALGARKNMKLRAIMSRPVPGESGPRGVSRLE